MSNVYYILQIIQGGVVIEVNCNSLENICGCMVVLCGQILLHKGIIAISLEKFMVTDRSTKITKLNHLKWFTIYGMSLMVIKKPIMTNIKNI